MIEICLLGTGGMMPLPHRFLTSLMVRYNGSAVLIDAGEGTQVAMKKKGWSARPIDVICFTHYHADHISGLPGLLLSMGNSERTEPVLLVGPKGLERVVNALRAIAPELPFPLVFRELTEAEEDIPLPGDDKFVIRAFKVNHNVNCYGYTMTLSRAGKFDAQRAKEQGIPLKFWSRLQDGEIMTDETGRVFTPDMVLGPPRAGLKLCYTTDTRPCPSIKKNAYQADLFICEGMYGEEDRDNKAKEYKHMTFREAAHLAADAEVKELWLTHYSPLLLRPEQSIGAVRQIFPNAHASKDGRSTELVFAE